MFHEFGLNVAGYLTAELGLGEVARNYVSVIKHLGVETSLQDASFITHQRKEATDIQGFTYDNPYPANLVCINAPEIKHFIERFGASYFRTKYNIGSWWWEVEELPQEWKNEFYRFDELWVGTKFIQNNFEKVSPIPIIVVPPYVVPLTASPCRAELGLAPEDFVFLFAFDYFSCFERKNPIGIVRAFRQAFKKNERAKLLIKTTNAEKFQAKFDLLRNEAGEDPRIILLDKYCSKPELNNMIASCDAYISLHRTEGFGLPIAEAMLLKKPVIATGWSGNLDFTTNENSLLVKYGFSTNEEDYGPYKKGMRWAEPDVEHAAKLMRVLFEDQSHAKVLGERGAATIREQFGREAVAHVISSRLEKMSRKVLRLSQIDSFKKGLLVLERAVPSASAAPAPAPVSVSVSAPAPIAGVTALTGSTAAPLVATADTIDQSETVVDDIEAALTEWWHRPLLGKPLRLLSKCLARLLENMLRGAAGSSFRRDMIETAFEGVAQLAKADSDQIEMLERRLQILEAKNSSKNESRKP